MVHWLFILGQGWLLSNHVSKACQNCLRPSFTRYSADAWIVALLWKLPQMPSCSANNANNNTFDMFYQTDCCAAINGWIWMNTTKWKYNNYAIMLFVISFFDMRSLESNSSFLFFYSHCILPWTYYTWTFIHALMNSCTCHCHKCHKKNSDMLSLFDPHDRHRQLAGRGIWT